MTELLAAMNPVTVATFLGAGILLNLTLGADVVFASASGMSGGWRAGVAAAFGISLGSLFHVSMAALGLSALLLALPHAFDVIRWLGAGYLAYLAWRAWNAQADLPAGRGAKGLRHAVLRGFLTNALNPKVALFVLAFLPQFTDPAIGALWPQMLLLGAMFCVTGFVITAAYGAASGLFGAVLQRRLRLMNRITAIVFGGLAARLVLD